MKLITLFSGIGMQEEGIKRCIDKMELVNFCEYDKKIAQCFEILHNVSSDKNLGDIRDLDIDTYYEKLEKEGNSDIDLLISSFPCQSFSIAGKKEGFDCPKNGNLFSISYNLIKKLLPTIVIFENVKNITNKKFNATETIKEKMNFLDYTCYDKILNGIDFGIPQNRERWFMVCIRKPSSFSFPDPIPLEKNVSFFLESNIEVRKKDSRLEPFFNKEYIKTYSSSRGLKKVFDGSSQFPDRFKGGFTMSRIYSIYGSSPTFTTTNDTHFMEIGGKLSARERWRLMGLEDKQFDLLKEHQISDNLIHKICGNGIIVDVFEHLFQKIVPFL